MKDVDSPIHVGALLPGRHMPGPQQHRVNLELFRCKRVRTAASGCAVSGVTRNG